MRLLQHQPLVSRSLRLGRLSLQTQMLQCIVEVFVNLLRLLAGLQVREILTDLLDQLIQHLDCHLQRKHAQVEQIQADMDLCKYK